MKHAPFRVLNVSKDPPAVNINEAINLPHRANDDSIEGCRVNPGWSLAGSLGPTFSFPAPWRQPGLIRQTSPPTFFISGQRSPTASPSPLPQHPAKKKWTCIQSKTRVVETRATFRQDFLCTILLQGPPTFFLSPQSFFFFFILYFYWNEDEICQRNEYQKNMVHWYFWFISVGTSKTAKWFYGQTFHFLCCLVVVFFIADSSSLFFV